MSLSALQNLDLSDNNIGSDGGNALAGGFKFLSALQNLDLSDNNIGSDGGIALAGGLSFCLHNRSWIYLVTTLALMVLLL